MKNLPKIVLRTIKKINKEQFMVLALYLLVSSPIVYGQCKGDCFLTVQQNANCTEESVQIEAKTNGIFKGWYNQNGAVVSTENISSINPKNYSSITAKAALYSNNMISNGNFESGKTGFKSDYSYKDTVIKNSQYSVGKNPKLTAASGYANQRDHTTGSGNMLIADGSTDSTKAVYRINVNVVAGQQYLLSSWVSNIHSEFRKPSPDTNVAKTSHLQLFIDSVLVDEYKSPLDTVWHPFSTTWRASSSKTIQVEIKSKIVSTKGNDFAIDDIYLGSVFTQEALLTIKPCEQNPELVLSPDGDGNYDSYYIAEAGMAKVYDLDGNVVKEINAPASWDGSNKHGAIVDAGYYAIVVNNSKIYRVSLFR